MAASLTCSPASAKPSRRIRRRPQDRFHVPKAFSTRQRTRRTRALCASSLAGASGPPQARVRTTDGMPPRERMALQARSPANAPPP